MDNREIIKIKNKDIPEIKAQLDEIANKGTTVEVLERVTKEEIDRQVADGTIANLTIEDDSITKEKLKEHSVQQFTVNTEYQNINLFDKTKITDNKLLNGTSENTNANYCITDFIKIEPNKTYIVSCDRPSSLGFFYDANKRLISNIGGSGSDADANKKEIFNNVNAIYVRFNIKKDIVNLDEYYVIDKDKETYKNGTVLKWLRVNNSNLSEDFNFSKSKIEGFIKGEIEVNLFNKETFNDTEFLNGEGGVTPNINYPKTGHTDYIQVEPNTIYKLNFNDITTWLEEYTENKTFIKHTAGRVGVPPSLITTTPNTKYIRVNVNTIKITLDDFYVVKKANDGSLSVDTYDWLEDRLKLFNTGGGTGGNDLMSNKFKGMNVLVTGDSITEKNGRCTFNWHDYLKTWYGFNNVYNDGISGSGLVKNNGIVYRIPNWETKYGNDVDMILIMGNMNDGTSGTTGTPQWLGTFADQTDDKKDTSLYGALHYTCKQLIERYPNIPIGFIISQPRSQVGSQGKCWGIDGWFERWVQAINEVCGHYSIPILDLYHNSGLRPWNADNNLKYFSSPSSPLGDGIHPNDLGQELMARKIYEFINQYM